jgi:hypothetical protein
MNRKDVTPEAPNKYGPGLYPGAEGLFPPTDFRCHALLNSNSERPIIYRLEIEGAHCMSAMCAIFVELELAGNVYLPQAAFYLPEARDIIINTEHRAG